MSTASKSTDWVFWIPRSESKSDYDNSRDSAQEKQYWHHLDTTVSINQPRVLPNGVLKSELNVGIESHVISVAQYIEFCASADCVEEKYGR